MSDLILYTSEDGTTRLDLRAEGGTVWLTQLEIAELFQTTKNNVSMHTKGIFEEGELLPEATVKESLTVQSEGVRQVKRTITYYNLDLILAIGYRVRSPRGTQFRQWASRHLKEFITKGFVMDDERLKNPISIPSVSVRYAQDGSSTRSNALGMRAMQERAYQKRGEQYLLIKAPPASGKSRALMFIALDVPQM